MSTGDWLILTRTKSLLKSVPTYLKKKGLFFESAQGNSVGKSLYEDIQYWSKLQKKIHLPDIQVQRIKERIKGAKKSTAKQDEEYRVWYVGVTRSMKNLYLIKSQNKSKEFKL